MRLWSWNKGRLGSGYRKFVLAYSEFFKFDAYLLVIPKGVVVPPHFDSAPEGYQHFRFNLTLRRAHSGGETLIRLGKDWRILSARSYTFRPDIQEHMVTRVHCGSLWLLSIGWLKHDKQSR